MKNRIFILALAVLFVSAMFIGCAADDPQAPVAADVKVRQLTPNTDNAADNKYGNQWEVEITTAKGRNVMGYDVYLRKVDTVTAETVDVWQGNPLEVKAKDKGGYIDKSSTINADKWYAKINEYVSHSVGDSKSNVGKAGEYQIGVRAYSDLGNVSTVLWLKDTIELKHRTSWD